MKKLLTALCVVGLLALGWYLFSAPASDIVYQSPGGEYRLIVRPENRDITVPGDSGPANTPAVVVLKDRDGTIIAKSTAKPSCGIFMGSVDVRWDLANDMVWYGRAKGMNVNTGSIEC